MHADEVDTDPTLVRRLIAAQFPRWAGLPIKAVPSSGTVNALYRLGEDMVVRLPRIADAEASMEKEQRWLPVLAPQLPLSIPTLLASGTPGEGYPFPWSVFRWLDGENATIERVRDLNEFAITLAQVITSLQQIHASDGPRPERGERGAPLAERDAAVRAAIMALNGVVNTNAVTAAWDAALRAAPWERAPVWLHGDLYDDNLLVVDGRLRAVIDFGCLAVGDPAADLIVAWSLFYDQSRTVFRNALAADDATWARGRGWALSVALIALPYYIETNPVIVERSRRRITSVLEDHELCE